MQLLRDRFVVHVIKHRFLERQLYGLGFFMFVFLKLIKSCCVNVCGLNMFVSGCEVVTGCLESKSDEKCRF